jgi:hypothetical protein
MPGSRPDCIVHDVDIAVMNADSDKIVKNRDVDMGVNV